MFPPAYNPYGKCSLLTAGFIFVHTIIMGNKDKYSNYSFNQVIILSPSHNLSIILIPIVIFVPKPNQMLLMEVSDMKTVSFLQQ